MKNNLRGNWKLCTIWENQNGLCSICKQKITLESEWETHHIQRDAKEAVTTQALSDVHPNCHRQIHSQN